MTRLSKRAIGLATALGAVCVAWEAVPAWAQCATCATPTVAYSPVVVPSATVVQPTIVRTGWYPGRFFDRLRLSRWYGGATAAPTYTAGYAPMTYAASYAPSYTAAYAPAYTAAYAPAYTAAYAPASYTASYAPYITAYAPLQTAVVTASYAPAATSGCSSCGQAVTTSYAPSTVYRPMEVSPVVETTVAAPACSACAADAPCSACSSCSSGVSQAVYEGAPTSGCASCAASSGNVIYDTPTGAPIQGSSSAPQTPPPTLAPGEGTPSSSGYRAEGPAGSSSAPAGGASATPENSAVDPKPLPEETEQKATGSDSTTSFDFGAPPLIGPQNDRTAHRPTVDIHDAVYRQPAQQSRVSAASAKVVVPASTARKVDANGWYAVGSR